MGAVGGGVTAAQGAWDFLSYVRGVRNTDVVSALFDARGSRIYGSDKINVIHLVQDRPDVWYFTVEAVEGYTFVRFPVIQSPAEELSGRLPSETNPDSRYWRWIQRARAGTILDGSHEPPNLKVEFVVVGYRPKALVDYFNTRH